VTLFCEENFGKNHGRLRAVSLFLENPRGRTQNKWTCENREASGDAARRFANHARTLTTGHLCGVLPHGFSSKRETARSLESCHVRSFHVERFRYRSIHESYTAPYSLKARQSSKVQRIFVNRTDGNNKQLDEEDTQRSNLNSKHLCLTAVLHCKCPHSLQAYICFLLCSILVKHDLILRSPSKRSWSVQFFSQFPS